MLLNLGIKDLDPGYGTIFGSLDYRTVLVHKNLHKIVVFKLFEFILNFAMRR